jgi:hypothetical protein
MKQGKQLAVICVFLLILILPKLSEAQAQSSPLIIPIPGFNAAEESGVFDLADCLAQAQGGEVLSPDKVNLKLPGIRNAWDQGYDALLDFLISKEPRARKKLERVGNSIMEAAVDAHNIHREVHIVCHSWGCTLALRVVQDLNAFNVEIDTMIMIDRITVGYPHDSDIPGHAPIRPDGDPPNVPANVKKIFIVRQEWDLSLTGEDVVIDNLQSVVGNFNLRLRGDSPTEEERGLLRKVRNEYKYKFDRKLERGLRPELHTFLDDSSVIWKLAAKGVERPCECINIAGTWDGSETGTATCTVAGETETEPASASGMVTIEQNGCDISVPHPSFDVVRTGTVKRNIIRISGPVFIPLEAEVSFTENTFNAKGQASRLKIDLNGSGIAEGTATVEGESFPFSCTLNSNAVLVPAN